MAEFKDHFSGLAANYAAFRPHYPGALYAELAKLVDRHELAWDCGCGNGQASVGLANHFDRVIATDPSAPQIDKAIAADRVTYAVCPAEDAPVLKDDSVDLILAAQAAHWFDLPKFYDEFRRVARPSAKLVLLSYRPTQVDDGAANAALQHFYTDGIGAYWPPERHHVDEGYANIPFPFPEEPGPDLTMEVSWPLDRLVAYAGTWSAVKEYRAKTGKDPLPGFRDALAEVWGNPDAPKRVFWPLTFRIGRVV